MALQGKPRIGGLILFLGSSALSFWFYNHTIAQALTHEKEALSMPAAFAAIVSIAMVGLAMMVLGTKLTDYSKGLRGREKTPKDYLLIGGFIVPGILAFFFLKHQLAQLGYQ